MLNWIGGQARLPDGGYQGAQGESGAEGWADFQPAALLSNGAASGEATLLMRSGGFASGQSFEMFAEAGSKSSIFIPLKLLEQGADYDLGKFREMVRDQSEAEQ